MPKNPEKPLQQALAVADELIAATAASTNDDVIIARLSLQQCRVSSENKRLQRRQDRRVLKLEARVRTQQEEIKTLQSALAEANTEIGRLRETAPAMKPKSDISIALQQYEESKRRAAEVTGGRA